jgi:hypothetical protein
VVWQRDTFAFIDCLWFLSVSCVSIFWFDISVLLGNNSSTFSSEFEIVPHTVPIFVNNKFYVGIFQIVVYFTYIWLQKQSVWF